MSIQDLGSIGEFVAALVVVVTLIILTVQMRQNTRAVKNASALSGVRFWSDYVALIANDTETTDIYARGAQSFGALRPEEKVRFDLLAVTFMKAAETFFRLNRDGALDPSEWESWERTIADVIGRPGFQQWWQERKHRYSDEFQEWIELKPPTSTPSFYPAKSDHAS
ncbi:MAG: hypothetical protein JRG89_21690 [Deltaproteobacteria bacterium]|nr:hypothetical protein [Deltaproteobacteria bacterium]MBW2391025.1 hypothetical protein [Deltaproteobacteria bacterium]